MEKFIKKILCFVMPIMLVAIVGLGILIPMAERKKEDGISLPSSDANIYYASAEDSGASTADITQKGGAIYLGTNSSLTMEGGEINGHSNTYGGAVYVSSGATFTMSGGTISGNSATYGGAIYIASGGTCNITSGTITGNSATYAPAIYVEDGGNLSISSTAVIENNTTTGEGGVEEPVVETISLTFNVDYYFTDVSSGYDEWTRQGVSSFSFVDSGETYSGDGTDESVNLTLRINKGLTWYEVVETYGFQFTFGADSTAGSSAQNLHTNGYWNLDSDNPIFTLDTTIVFNYTEIHSYYVPCFSVETEILCYDEKKKRFYKKKLKDLTYKDKVVVWNFDKGCMDISQPLFITKSKFAHRYTEVRFSDGSVLKLVGESDEKRHRIFNVETNKFEYVGSNMKIGTVTLNDKGEKVKVESIKFIDGQIEYASLITNQHINCFAGGILTTASGRMSHLYEIKDMKFVKEPRKAVDAKDYPEIERKYFDGLRLAERELDVNDVYVNDYTKFVNDWKSRSK